MDSGSADFPITAYIHNLPLPEFMSALASLMSYRGAVWHWEKKEDTRGVRYTLIRPRSARRIHSQLQNEIQKRFMSEANLMEELVFQPPHAISSKERASNPYVNLLLQSSRRREGLQMFFQTLSQQQRNQLLSGTGIVSLPIDRLSPNSQQFVRRQFDEGKLTDSTGNPVKFQGEIGFQVNRTNAGLPTMSIMIDGDGYSYLGGPLLKDNINRHIKDLWLLRGDKSPDTKREAMNRPEKKRLFCHPSPLPYTTLHDLADYAGISMLCRLPAPNERRMMPDTPFWRVGSPLKDFLSALTNTDLERTLHYKWHNGVLLMSSPHLLLEETEEARVPYSIFASLRAREEESFDGFLQLYDLLYVAGVLRPQQLLQLAQDVPVMQGVARWQKFLTQLKNPETLQAITSDAGILLTSNPSLVQTIPTISEVSLTAHGVKRLRLSLINETKENLPRKRFRLETLDSEGKTLHTFGFTYRRYFSEVSDSSKRD
jgi:hypothetical protein